MSDIVKGFQNQTWCIMKMNGLETVEEERIPLNEASEDGIISLLEKKAAGGLTAREVKDAPHLFKVRKDLGGGNRVLYTAGQNPHYVASLWRADEGTSS